MNDILYTFPILIRGIQLQQWRSVDDLVRDALLRSAEEIIPVLMQPSNAPMRRQLMVNLEVLASEAMGDRVVEILNTLKASETPKRSRFLLLKRLINFLEKLNGTTNLEIDRP